MSWAPRYCGAACRAEHWAAGAAGAARPVPHAAVCAVLARFGSLKCDAGMESVLRMCLDALALLRQETECPADPMQGSNEPSAGAPGSPAGARAAACRAPDPVQGARAGLQAGTLDAAEASKVLVGAPAPELSAPSRAPCAAAGPAAGCAPCTGEHAAGRRGRGPIQGCEPGVRTGAASQGPGSGQGCNPSQHAEVHGAASPGPDSSQGPEPCYRPALRHDDLLRLQDHSRDLPPRDRADWLKALRFLSHALAAEGWLHLPVLGSGPGSDAMRHAGTPAVEPACRAGAAACGGLDPDPAGCRGSGPDPGAPAARMDPQALLGLVGRICTNNFGVFRGCGEGRARAPSPGPGPSCGARPGLGTCGPGLAGPASRLRVQQGSHAGGSVLGEAGAWPLAAPECAARPSEARAARNGCLSGAAECSPADALRDSTGPCARPEGSSAAEQPDDAASVAVASGAHTTEGVPEAFVTPAQCSAAARGEGRRCSSSAPETGAADLEAPASTGRAHLAVPGHEHASSAGACPGTRAASVTREACMAAAAAAVHGVARVALDCPLEKGMRDAAVRSGPLPAGSALPNSVGGMRDPAARCAGGPHSEKVLVGRGVFRDPAAALAGAPQGPDALIGSGGMRDPAAALAGAPHAQEVLVGRELYIAGSFINHACAPNCVLVRGQGWATVTTLRSLAVSRLLLQMQLVVEMGA